MDEDPHTREASKNALLRALPSIEGLLTDGSLEPILASHPRPRRVAALRRAVDLARSRILAGDARPFSEEDVTCALRELTTPNLRPVLNATGVVLHTNLGRAPLAPAAAERVKQIAEGYSNLEFDLDEGERGSRYAPVVALLTGLTGAEDAVVVNNNAAAVLLVLAALAQGREVVVSRGELVEIGGGFRVPEVMRQSGAKLVEVGTTNRTRLLDYARAVTPETALLCKVHRSNFALVGFTEEVAASELAKLGREKGLPVFEDLGSGCLVPLEGEGLTPEPTVRAAVEAGADVVSFSGDKLLGGPQAGVIVGRRELVARIRQHPLNRAVRVDKMTVAALEATLELYRDGLLDRIPALRLLAQDEGVLEARAQRLRGLLKERGVEALVERVEGQVGGGAMPLAKPVSYACALEGGDPQGLQDALRAAEPPIIARVSEGRVLLDVRCLGEEQLGDVAGVVRGVLQRRTSC